MGNDWLARTRARSEREQGSVIRIMSETACRTRGVNHGSGYSGSTRIDLRIIEGVR